MLRGTIYIVREHVIAGPGELVRVVKSFAVETPQEFEQCARTRLFAGGGLPPDARLEFGPISPPWQRMSV